MQLTERMKDCLRLAMENDQLEMADIVETAVRLHFDMTGEPLVVEDEEEFSEFSYACVSFVADQVLSNLILKGVVEVAGIDGEDMYYQLTEEYKETLNGES